eukprot:scaffold8442_cov193-Ochromonas_danica.AAC.1
MRKEVLSSSSSPDPHSSTSPAANGHSVKPLSIRALKPKPRKVKQIELDEYLRPIEDSVTSKGRESEARAAKRK